MTLDYFASHEAGIQESELAFIERRLSSLHDLISQNHQAQPTLFAEKIIHWLARETGALQGVFWRTNGHDNTMHFAGGFACTENSLHKRSIHKESDSPYRSLFETQEVIFTTNIKGLYLPSATHSIPLRSWLVLPVSMNGKLLATLELYHHTIFSDQDLHLLLKSLIPIAAAWLGVVEQDRRKVLIDQLKEKTEQLNIQNEEIQAQGEELRQQAEELSTINENMEIASQQLQEKNKELTLALQELSSAKYSIEKKNQNILASIQYGWRIQRAMLPSEDELKTTLGEHALLFIPRDIISGDFYWVAQNNQGTWVAVADCTGHGVPAAMMGMMGVNLLEHIASSQEFTKPSEVLGYLDKRVRNLIGRGKNQTNDGMDMSLCFLDHKNKTIHYAGAMSSAYYFSGEGLEVLQHDRHSIGGRLSTKKSRKFCDQTCKMQEDGMLYLFSDGFQDQFGGEENRKFMRRNFRQLLSDIWMMPTQEQEGILEQTFLSWRGTRSQTDDVLILAIRL